MELSKITKGLTAIGFLHHATHLFAIFACLLLGLTVYKRSPMKPNNRSFLFMSLAFAILAITWYVGDFIFLPHAFLLFDVRLGWSAGFLVSISVMRFCLTFPENNRKRPWHYWLLTLINIAFVFIAISTNWVIKDFIVKNGELVFTPGSSTPFLKLGILTLVLITAPYTTTLYLKIKRFHGKKRVQLQYVLLAIGGFAACILAIGLIPVFLFDYYQAHNFYPLSVVIFVGVTSYAVIKHRLMDIRLVVLKSVTYTILVSVITTIYIFFGLYLKNKVLPAGSPNIIFIGTTFIVAFSFQPLKNVLEIYLGRIFAKGHYNSEDLLKAVGQTTSNSLSLDYLSENVLRILLDAMRVPKATFVLKEGFYHSLGFDLGGETEGLLRLAENGDVVVADELDDDSSAKIFMQSLGVEVLVFFPDEGEGALGFLALSPKASGDVYTSQDLNLLEVIAPQITIAVRNIEKSREIIEGIIEERNRINLDAHDTIYNRLLTLATKADFALDDPDQAKPTLGLLRDDLRLAVRDLRNIVSGRQDSKRQTLFGLKTICDDFARRSGIEVNFACDEDLDLKVESSYFWHLHCILEECLSNILKHSQATRANVEIATHHGQISLKVADNGIGINQVNSATSECKITKPRLGLASIKQRAQEMRGTISINSNESGTLVELEIPLKR